MALADTFPGYRLPPLSDGWMAEIGRRSAERAAGTATTIPWEVVRVEAIPDTLPPLTKAFGKLKTSTPKEENESQKQVLLYYCSISQFCSEREYLVPS